MFKQQSSHFSNPIVKQHQNTWVNEFELTVKPKHSPKKARLKRATTILDENGKSSTFEDSRITMLLFEKYRLVEMLRFFLIIAGQVLSILQYEYFFQDQFEQRFTTEITLILYLIFILTIVTIVITLISYQVFLAYQKKAMLITPDATLFETYLVQWMIIEIILTVICPTPFTQGIKIHFIQRYEGTVRYYYLNEILTYIMLFRVVLMINITLKFQSFYSSQIGRICRLYSTDFDTHLIFKICMKDIPGYTLIGLFSAGLLLFGYGMEIAERSLIRDDISYTEYNIGNSLWVTLITIATVGYGDFYPITDLGRFSMSICVIWGVSNTSLFTAMLTSMLEAESSEEMVWAVLEKTSVSRDMRNQSQYLFTQLQSLRLNRTIQINDIDNNEQNQISTIQEALKEITNLRRQYRDIDGEDTMSMALRKFKDISNQFEEQKQLLQDQKKLQMIIGIHYQYAIESQFPSNQKKSSPHIATYQTDDKRSKDEDYFANLEDSKQDPFLMEFND